MSRRRRLRLAPPLSARDTAEIAAFAQLLGIEHARRSLDAVPWVLDVAEAALYPDGLGGDEAPRPAPGSNAVDRLVCALSRGGSR
jgi:hypothetical protein